MNIQALILIYFKIREMEMLFGYQFWENVVLEATFWPYDEHSTMVRNASGKTEEWWTNDKNAALQNLYHLNHNLSVSIKYIMAYNLASTF